LYYANVIWYNNKRDVEILTFYSEHLIHFRREVTMENVEKKSGFLRARFIVTIVISLLVVTSFVIFGYFQEQSKHLLDAYLGYVNSLDRGTSVSTILKTVSFLF